MIILNFIFVYVLAGFILGSFFISVFKKQFDTVLQYVLGYGIAPLFISLQLYYLYWFFPQRSWSFYASSIYGFWILLLVVDVILFKFLKHTIQQNWSFKTWYLALRRLTITSRILIVFIFLVVGFIFIRGQLYPNLWADGIFYFQQGHVYSADHALDRLTSLIPFWADGSSYVMNPSIRPAIPVFYSFFVMDPTVGSIFIFSGSFLYFYYFILALGIFSYILKKFHCSTERVLLGITLLLTSYYLSNFLIYGFKEIILIFLILSALFISYTITKKGTTATLKSTIILGALVGLLVYINLSGVIIGGIIGSMYCIELLVRRVPWKRVITSLVTFSIFLVAFSGAELAFDLGFIFNIPIPFQSARKIGATEASEYSIYKITSGSSSQVSNTNSDTISQGNSQASTTSSTSLDTTLKDTPQTSSTTIDTSNLKRQVLIKGKLQGFTQIQFYGIIFLLFMAIVIIRVVQKNKLTHFEKNILGFFGLFFFVVMDPFFLNTHPQGYVLSISPKYTILLIPLAALFVTLNYDVVLRWFVKIPIKYLLLVAGFILLLVPTIRELAVHYTLNIFNAIVPLYNSPEYYMAKFDALYVGAGIFSFIVTAIACYCIAIKITPDKKTATINFLFITSFFILPYIFLLASNYSISNTLQHVFASQETKLFITNNDEKTLSFLQAIHYLNTQTDHKQKILLLSLASTSLIYHIQDYHRFLFEIPSDEVTNPADKIIAVQDAEYILMQKNDFETYRFNTEVKLDQDFGSTIILRVIR